MKLLIINGSPRAKGLLSQMLDIMQQEAESNGVMVEIVKTNNLEMLSQVAEVLEMPVEDVIGLNKRQFSISGFIKVDSKTFEIESKADVEAVLNKISELEEE